MKTILLTEDDPFLIDIYSTKLRESGFKLDVATDGEQCLAKLRQRKPEVLVLDIVLPKLSGWEVLEKMKQDKRFNGIKIIVLSNLGQREEIEKALRLGATEYLIKAHYTPSQVVGEIKKILE